MVTVNEAIAMTTITTVLYVFVMVILQHNFVDISW